MYKIVSSREIPELRLIGDSRQVCFSLIVVAQHMKVRRNIAGFAEFRKSSASVGMISVVDSALKPDKGDESSTDVHFQYGSGVTGLASFTTFFTYPNDVYF